MQELLLIAAFFLIAMIYASVGFGGGTSYLALMTIMAVPFETMRPAALLCNIVVVTGGTFIFWREGALDFRRIWPFLLLSVPLAYLGGYFPITETIFFRVLGFTLITASIALWFHGRLPQIKAVTRFPGIAGALLGGAIGLLSGLVSIGGGIFLSPVLHFIRWDDARRISALASAFILVNSVSGLAGQLTGKATLDWQFAIPLMGAVFIGGQFGSHWGAHKFQAAHIRKVTAILILVAGVNILINH